MPDQAAPAPPPAEGSPPSSPPPAVMPLDEAPRQTRHLTYGYAVALGLLLAVAPAYLLSTSLPLLGPPKELAFLAEATLAGVLVFGTLRLTRRAGRRGTHYAASLLTGLLALVALPLVGLLVDSAAHDCTPSCDGDFRPLAFPEVFGLVPLHAAAALAYFVSLRRPEALSPRAEVAIVAGLGAGLVLHGLMAVQFFDIILAVVFIIPVPVLTPFLCLVLLLHQLVTRLQRRAQEASGGAPWKGPAGAAALLGLHAVLSAALFRSPTGGLDAFLLTCGYPLSQLPLPPPDGCHYLCTIAAQGSPRLVKPYRWGRRGGRAIVVNRQLALANAFEDLLHERWPRLGRLARWTYDRLALNLSPWLCRRWLANAVYVVMKPAEAVFLVTLLLFDPGDPEARVARMYR